MSFIGNMFDPSKGAGFTGSTSNDVTNSVTNDQFQRELGNTNQALQQQDLAYNLASQQPGNQNLANTFNQLQAVANGQGPNPAQAQLAQATGANTANQASLMAGQRGASANPALLARMAAQQGGANQQAAAGQAATLQAQQSLGALGQQGAIAQNQVGNLQNATNAATAAHQAQQQQLLNQIAAQNNAAVGMQSNVNSVNGGIAGANLQAQAGLLSGGMGALGAVAGLAHGGMVQNYADGGQVDNSKKTVDQSKDYKQKMQDMSKGAQQGQSLSEGWENLKHFMKGENYASGGQVAQSSFAKYMDGSKQPMNMVSPMSQGGHVDGKAQVHGDNEKNDTVPAMLSPGEIVIPRSVSQGKDAPKKAAAFVAAVLARGGHR